MGFLCQKRGVSLPRRWGFSQESRVSLSRRWGFSQRGGVSLKKVGFLSQGRWWGPVRFSVMSRRWGFSLKKVGGFSQESRISLLGIVQQVCLLLLLLFVCLFLSFILGGGAKADLYPS